MPYAVVLKFCSEREMSWFVSIAVVICHRSIGGDAGNMEEMVVALVVLARAMEKVVSGAAS